MELLGITTIKSEVANTEPPNLTRFGRILSYVMPPGTTRRRLYKFLRQSHRKRRKRYGSCEKRGQIPDRRLIDKRPELVNECKRIGDWESDTVVGKGRGSYTASHVERKSKYTVIAKMKYKAARSMTLATMCALSKNPGLGKAD